MSIVTVSAFQQDAERDVRALLEKYKAGPEARAIKTADVGPFANKTETAIQILASGIEVWIYTEGATYIVGSRQARFERPDFSSNDELRNKFIRELEESLKQR